MILRSFLTLVALAVPAPAALAQSAAGAPPSQSQPAAEPLGGPVVAGVCLLSREAVFANAAVGRAAAARLQELTLAAQAEIDQQRTPIEAEARSFEGQADDAAARQRAEQLTVRWQALQGEAAHNGREIEATRVKAMARISNEAQPVIAEVYRQKNCGLLFDRNSALGGNFANDLTADVVGGLDARIQTISFERERLPRQQPTAQ